MARKGAGAVERGGAGLLLSPPVERQWQAVRQVPDLRCGFGKGCQADLGVKPNSRNCVAGAPN